jgi:thymidylate synthase
MSKQYLSYADLVQDIVLNGVEVGDTLELCHLQIQASQMRDICIRKLAVKGALDEAHWILDGSSDTRKAGRAASFWRHYPPDLGDIYGSHLRKQWHEPVLNSRKDYFETGYWGAMVPCVNSLQLLRRKHGIIGIVNQRSADIICGLPHDILTWQYIANWVAKNPVLLYWNIGSAHVYKQHLDIAQEIIHSRRGWHGGHWNYESPFTEKSVEWLFERRAEVLHQGGADAYYNHEKEDDHEQETRS